MTQAPEELTAVQLCQNRIRLRRLVGELLAGSGLEIRELEKELVISNPGHPDKGRIYITYATGEVSLRQVLWDYWGYLDGYGRAVWADPKSESTVELAKIINTLGGQVRNSS